MRSYKVALIIQINKKNSGFGITEYGRRLYGILKKEPSLSIKMISVTDFSLLKHVIGFSNGDKFDLVHYTDPSGVLLGHFLNCKKTIVTVHDLDFFMPLALGAKARYYGLTSLLKKPEEVIIDSIYRPVLRHTSSRSIKQADKIVCVSEITKREVIKKFDLNPSKCAVIYPVIDRQFHPLIKSKHKKTVVGHISSYLYNKNVRALVEAFEMTNSNALELRLYGRNCPFNSSDPRVRRLGFVPQKALNRVYNSFDVFVFPSIYEGFGMPIMEAKRCKIPVITYKGGKLPEIAKRNTLQFSTKEELRDMLEEHAWKKVDVKKAYEDTKACEPDYIKTRTLSMYKKVIDR